jgi:hypothetical protein
MSAAANRIVREMANSPQAAALSASQSRDALLRLNDKKWAAKNLPPPDCRNPRQGRMDDA